MPRLAHSSSGVCVSRPKPKCHSIGRVRFESRRCLGESFPTRQRNCFASIISPPSAPSGSVRNTPWGGSIIPILWWPLLRRSILRRSRRNTHHRNSVEQRDYLLKDFRRSAVAGMGNPRTLFRAVASQDSSSTLHSNTTLRDHDTGGQYTGPIGVGCGSSSTVFFRLLVVPHHAALKRRMTSLPRLLIWEVSATHSRSAQLLGSFVVFSNPIRRWFVDILREGRPLIRLSCICYRPSIPRLFCTKGWSRMMVDFFVRPRAPHAHQAIARPPEASRTDKLTHISFVVS